MPKKQVFDKLIKLIGGVGIARYVVHFQCSSGKVSEILAELTPVGKPAQQDLHGSYGYAFTVVMDMTRSQARALRPKLEQAGAQAVVILKSL